MTISEQISESGSASWPNTPAVHSAIPCGRNTAEKDTHRVGHPVPPAGRKASTKETYA